MAMKPSNAMVVGSRAHRTWTAFAAALLFLLALPFGVFAGDLIGEILARGHAPGASGGVFEAMAGLAALMLLIAAAHIVAAAQAWRQRVRPGSLAGVVGLSGLALGSAAFAITFFNARDVAALVLLFPVSYLAVLLALRAARPASSAVLGAD